MPGFDDKEPERLIKDRAHDLKHAMKRMEHDIKQAQRDRVHAIRHTLRHDGEEYANLHRSGPRSVEDVLVEIDSYISYLEDLPREKLVPYREKIDALREHLDKVRGSLNEEAGTK